MAGSNRSASLRDPQSSLPVGTLSAILVTSTIYLVSVVTYGSVASRCAKRISNPEFRVAECPLHTNEQACIHPSQRE